MKIQLLSDLHLEFRPFTLKVNPQADLVILAGDFGPIHKVANRIRNVFRNLGGKPAIVVLGNHDFYESTIASTITEFKKLLVEFPNVELLDDSFCIFEKIRIVGGTLWTDFTLYEPGLSAEFAMKSAVQQIMDFGQIWKEGGMLVPADLPPLFQKCAEVIEQIVSTNLPTIVVTHFMPSARSIHPKFHNNSLNPYFCSPLEHLMRPNVKAWLHGHTHCSADYHVGETHVVCNPRGYNDGENKLFSSQLLVEV